MIVAFLLHAAALIGVVTVGSASATMFVVTGQIERKNPLYLDWTELHRMQDSGRWDIQPEAYQGHVQIAVDSRGDLAPFYAMRRYLRSTGEESFADYQRRVAFDLFTLAQQFKTQAIDVHALAVHARIDALAVRHRVRAGRARQPAVHHSDRRGPAEALGGSHHDHSRAAVRVAARPRPRHCACRAERGHGTNLQ